MSWDTITRAIEIFLVFDITAIVLLIAVSILLEQRDRRQLPILQREWRQRQRAAAEAMARRDREET